MANRGYGQGGLHGLLFESERALTDPKVRQSRARIEELLHPEFSEIGSAGRVYDRTTMIRMMTTEIPGEVVMRDFRVRELSNEVAIVTYRSIGTGNAEVRRTSVWVRRGSRWQIRHHQGTRVLSQWNQAR